MAGAGRVVLRRRCNQRDALLALPAVSAVVGRRLDTRLWTRRVNLGTALSGLFWGSAGAVLFPAGDLPHQVNHREFNARLIEVAQVAAKLREPYALLFIDLDRFKEINDTGGHAAGDETLRRIGRILKEHIRTSDTAARLGGDEFAILLPRCPRERAEQIAAKVLAAIESFALDFGGRRFRVGASIGVAYTDAGEHGAATMLRAADSARYAAKNSGRGRIQVHHADPLHEASGRFELSKLNAYFS